MDEVEGLELNLRDFQKCGIGCDFRSTWNFEEIQKADPVAWSLSAWAGTQCFRHFKGFCRVGSFKSHQIDNWSFNLFRSKRLRLKAFCQKSPKLAIFGSSKAGSLSFWPKLANLKFTNFGLLPAAKLRRRKSAVLKTADFRPIRVGTSGGACGRRRLHQPRQAAILGSPPGSVIHLTRRFWEATAAFW